MPRPFAHVPPVEARAALLAVGTALVLMGVKFLAYYLTGSAVIFSDAVESIVNVAAAGLAAYSLHYAHRPADASHPYGHGKIEFLSAGIEGGMILIAALIIAAKAGEALVNPVALEDRRLDLGMLLMAAALLVNGAVGVYLLRVGRRQASLTLEADGRHLLSDAVTSVATLGGLAVVRMTDLRWADPVAAMLLAGYIAWTGVALLRRAEAGLTDRQDPQDEKLLTGILDAHVGPSGREPRICSYHKLRHRHTGRYHWVDFHIMVPPDWTVARGHEVASAIEYEIEQALGEGNATAHIEPCGDDACAGVNDWEEWA